MEEERKKIDSFWINGNSFKVEQRDNKLRFSFLQPTPALQLPHPPSIES